MIFSRFPLQKNVNYTDFLQNKREMLEKIIRENESITLHPNHFLMTGAREKLIQCIIGTNQLNKKFYPQLKLKKSYFHVGHATKIKISKKLNHMHSFQHT